MNFEFLSRFWQNLGFGIESKTDFAYLHDVIREKHPYYAYNDLHQHFPLSTTADRRKAQLLFRLCNDAQPSDIRIFGTPTPINLAHIKAACPHATIHTTPGTPCSVYYASDKAHLSDSVLSKCAAQDHTLFIIEDISTTNHDIWQQLLALPHVITYDMHVIGIATIHLTRYPEHYKIKAP